MTIITHNQHAEDYHKGYNDVLADITSMGWNAARDKFNIDNPVGQTFAGMAAYYYAKGGIDALLKQKAWQPHSSSP